VSKEDTTSLTTIPERNLDNHTPDYVKCGAKKRGSGDPGKFCGNIAGQGTEHVGEGRCWLHGGAAGSGRPIIHGRRSSKPRISLMEAVTDVLNNEELLDASREVAILHEVLTRQMEAQDDLDENYSDRLQAWAESPGEEPMPEPPDPDAKLSLETIKALVASKRNAYEMKFSKRFSIPTEEVGMLLANIGEAFNQIATKYGLPHEARVEFGGMMRELKISKPIDAQLFRAGQDGRNRGQDGSQNSARGKITIDG
jgi:hypothetical protein